MPLTYFLEFDRTRRVDKNYEKSRRYGCFLNYWWRHTDLGGLDDAPWVIFICQDRDHAIQFLGAADHELTGDVSRPWCQDDDHVGRRRVAVCLERSVYEGSSHAWVVPRRPRRDWDEDDGERRVTRIWLPGRRPEPKAEAA